MAEKLIFQIGTEVDAKGAKQAGAALGDVAQEAKSVKEQLEGVEDTIRNVSKASADKTAQKQFQELNRIVDENVLSIQELGTAADNYKNIALAAGKESPIGKEAIRRAGELEREMDTLNQTVARGAEGGRALGEALTLGAGVAGGFAAVQGAMALVGDESDDLVQSLVKIQAAMAIAQGVREMKMAVTAFKNLNIATRLASAAQVVFNVVLNANPIGIVITLIGGLIAAIAFFPEIIQKAVKWFDNLGTTAKVVIGILAGPLLAAIYGIRKGLEALGVIESEADKEREKWHAAQVKRLKAERREIELLRDSIKDYAATVSHELSKTQKFYERELELAAARGKSEEELEKIRDRSFTRQREQMNRAEAELRNYAADAKANLRGLSEFMEMTGEQPFIDINLQTATAEELYALYEQIEDVKKRTFSDLKKMELDNAQETIAAYLDSTKELVNILEERDELEQDQELRKAQRQRDAQREAEQRYREHLEKMRDIERFYEDLRAENIENEFDRRMEQERLRYERLQAEYAGHHKVLEELEKQHLNNIREIRADFLPERVDAIKRENEQILPVISEVYKTEEQLQREQLERDRRTKELKVQAFVEEFDEKMKVVDGFFSTFTSLNQSFNQIQDNLRKKDEKASIQQQKNRFNREKALNIAGSAIETSKAIIASVAASPTTFGLPFSAFAAVTGAAQIAAIASQKFNPQGGGGTASIPTPSFSSTAIPQSDAQQDATGIDPQDLIDGTTPNGNEAQQRVYVMEGDIASTMNRTNQRIAVSEG